MNEKTATFGAGCFWGVEARFRAREGVVEATSGYMGGHKREPTYREVCAGDTGHAEVVEIRYDPGRVRYDELLELFFSIHDPTQLDRQGPDVGAQYRSAIFTHDDDQAAQARAAIERLTADGRFDRPIVTRVEPAGTFWRAEEYHQRYLDKNGVDACPV